MKTLSQIIKGLKKAGYEVIEKAPNYIEFETVINSFQRQRIVIENGEILTFIKMKSPGAMDYKNCTFSPATLNVEVLHAIFNMEVA